MTLRTPVVTVSHEISGRQAGMHLVGCASKNYYLAVSSVGHLVVSFVEKLVDIANKKKAAFMPS
jgi:hypothetical protein